MLAGFDFPSFAADVIDLTKVFVIPVPAVSASNREMRHY
jgi:hypothetical protein